MEVKEVKILLKHSILESTANLSVEERKNNSRWLEKFSMSEGRGREFNRDI